MEEPKTKKQFLEEICKTYNSIDTGFNVIYNERVNTAQNLARCFIEVFHDGEIIGKIHRTGHFVRRIDQKLENLRKELLRDIFITGIDNFINDLNNGQNTTRGTKESSD